MEQQCLGGGAIGGTKACPLVRGLMSTAATSIVRLIVLHRASTHNDCLYPNVLYEDESNYKKKIPNIIIRRLIPNTMQSRQQCRYYVFLFYVVRDIETPHRLSMIGILLGEETRR